jgi:hypothetical protein
MMLPGPLKNIFSPVNLCLGQFDEETGLQNPHGDFTSGKQQNLILFTAIFINKLRHFRKNSDIILLNVLKKV